MMTHRACRRCCPCCRTIDARSPGSGRGCGARVPAGIGCWPT